MKQTVRECLIAGLLAHGWRESKSKKSSKYAEFTHPDKDFNLYVGVHGALRAGTKISDALSLQGMPAYKEFIEAGQQRLGW